MRTIVRFKRAQSTYEYAIVIVIVVGALLATQNYLKRSRQGQLQSAGDRLGDQYDFGRTNAVEHVENEQDIDIIDLPGWNNPIKITDTDATFLRRSRRELSNIRD